MGADRARVGVPPALLALAKRSGRTTAASIPASLVIPQALPSASTLRRSPPHAPLRRLGTGRCALSPITQGPAPAPHPPQGRRRQGDPSRHFCPAPDCTYRGWLGWGTIRAHGHPHGGPWRQPRCSRWVGYLLEPPGTIVHGKRVTPNRLGWAVGALAEGLGSRAVARAGAGAPNTGLQGLVDAADQLKAVSPYFLPDVHVPQGRLDALCALLSAVQGATISEPEAMARLSRAPQWVWGAMAPLTKLLLTLDVGDRTLAMAHRVVQQGGQVLAPGGGPLVLTDGVKAYLPALLTPYDPWSPPPRRQAPGPGPRPRGMPLPPLRDAPGLKPTRRRRVGPVSHRGLFGMTAAVARGLAAGGGQLNTAGGARINLSLRQPAASIGRRTTTRCKGEAGWRHQLALDPTYYTFHRITWWSVSPLIGSPLR
jgi:hypothetical protein